MVVGEYGLVSRCLIPLSAQIRPDITGPGPVPNRPVNTFPLPVRIWAGTPCRRSAPASAWHTGRAVARSTALAHTTNREWSSIPVTILTSVPPARKTRPITSICHRPIARGRSHRRQSSRRRRRRRASTRPCRTSARYTADRPGNGTTPARSSSHRIRDGPHPGYSRRMPTIRASTSAGIWCGHDAGRDDRSASPPRPPSA